MRAAALVIAMLVAIGPPANAGEIAQAKRRSGYDFMSRETQAMQDDDTSSPAMLSVLDGEKLWSARAGAAGKACADCHQDATASMRGVAARYPAFDETSSRPVDLERRINLCRTRHQQATAFEHESPQLLALSAYVARQSRGMAIAPPDDPRLAPFVAAGRDTFMRRQGQLNLACSNCHDDNWDKHLAGAAITQAHPTAYPIYRLEWQSIGSLQRRLRACLTGIRAQAYDFDAPELVELELYLMTRARGMPMESPGVRP